MLTHASIEALKTQTATAIAKQLSLDEHADCACCEAALGRDPEIGDRYLDTTTGRVHSWDGTRWVTLSPPSRGSSGSPTRQSQTQPGPPLLG